MTRRPSALASAPVVPLGAAPGASSTLRLCQLPLRAAWPGELGIDRPDAGWHTDQMPRPAVVPLRGDITKLAVDATVNAANTTLSVGGGVDAAIHEAAGEQELAAACAEPGGCQTGDAKATPGFGLPAAGSSTPSGPSGKAASSARPHCWHRATAGRPGRRRPRHPGDGLPRHLDRHLRVSP
jgi:hypothetical protein